MMSLGHQLCIGNASKMFENRTFEETKLLQHFSERTSTLVMLLFVVISYVGVILTF